MGSQRALVTGASSGLGRALAAELAQGGYSLILVGRSTERLEETFQALSQEGQAQARILVADLGQPDQVEGLVERGLSLFGDGESVSVLVNNAGWGVSGAIEDIPLTEYRKSLEVNFLSTVSLVQQVLPGMRQKKDGLIVNVTSGVARRALPFISPYCVTKAALSSFTESLRVELGSENIDVLLFSPGPVDTGFDAARTHFGETRLVGPTYPGADASGVAKVLYRAIESRKKRVFLGGKANLVNHLNHFCPSLVDRIMAKTFKLEKK